jgi:hypothetical protein
MSAFSFWDFSVPFVLGGFISLETTGFGMIMVIMVHTVLAHVQCFRVSSYEFNICRASHNMRLTSVCVTMRRHIVGVLSNDGLPTLLADLLLISI